MLKCCLLITVLFIGILIGMQQAKTGLTQMRGYDDPSFKSAFSINEKENGNVEASIMGQKLTSHDLAEKKKKLEEMKAYNFFSSLGKKVSETISISIELVVDLFTRFLR